MDQSILSTVYRALKIEADTLWQLAESSKEDKNIMQAIQMMMECKGKLVVTGVGKSALIGQKIVATFNSTGSRSIFLHAADALHGDLGVIHQDDIVICLSKSGNTEELKALIPHIKKMGNSIISLVSNTQSYLYQNSDCAIHLAIEMEADVNNLAPTASTTAQLAMGDALAITMSHLKSFDSQKFAAYHPGGFLGKLLYTRVKDLSDKNAKPWVAPDASIDDVIYSISSARLGATAVLQQDQIAGIITDGDLRRMLQKKQYTSDLKAKDVMSHAPKTIDHDTLATEAAEYMKANSISQLIVISEGKYEGIIHIHDILKEGLV